MSYPYYYEEVFDGITIFETKIVEIPKPSYMVLGLPDAGLVGSISVSHMVRTLKMEEFGGIESYRFFPPVAVIHEGKPHAPIRFFYKDNVVVVVPEIAIPPQAIYPLSLAILDYAQKRGFDYIISITGAPVPNRMNLDKPRIYWLASNDRAAKLVSELKIDQFKEGLLVGPYAIIFKESVKRRVSNLLLLAETFMEFPDPEAAAKVLEVLSKVIGVKVDVAKLLEEAELIKIKTRELMKHTTQSLARMGKGYEYQMPLLYA